MLLAVVIVILIVCQILCQTNLGGARKQASCFYTSGGGLEKASLAIQNLE